MDAEASPSQQPYDLALKGQDIVDFGDFALDQDHRKRRRNRTTQSCLNCHTSKRKCDRKRPCSRCIQLGLTGLCVYEVDDPALRDDPNVDEATRLRNRIAELESLVRELRGKPHPRWADAAFCEGDPQDKWHSRAAKRPHISLSVRRHRDHLALGSVPDFAANHHHMLGQSSPSVKSEPGPDIANGFPYRFSPSPESHASSPYAAYPGSQPNGMHGGYPDPAVAHVQHQHAQQHGQYRDAHGSADDFYSPYSPTPPQQYPTPTHAHHHGGRASDPGQSPTPFCACLSNPGSAHHVNVIMLSQQLRATLQALMALPEHSMPHQAQACLLTRRVRELNDLLHSLVSSHSSGNEPSPSHYGAQQQQQQQQQQQTSHGYTPPSHHHPHAMHYSDTLSTPPETEVLTPLSSAEAAPVPAAQLHEWAALAHAQGSTYNPYFPPLPPADKAHVVADEYARQSAMVA